MGEGRSTPPRPSARPGRSDRLDVLPVTGMPEIGPGENLAALLVAALDASGTGLRAGDVLVVSGKVLSKSLGLHATTTGGTREDTVRAQSVRVVAERRTPDSPAGSVTRVVEALAGPVMAAAGVDASNTGRRHGPDALLLLPADPDAAAARLRRDLRDAAGLATGDPLGVVLSDTAGRPWREGQVDFALGAAGILPLLDHRGESDHDGRALGVTARALADEVAALADLVKGKADGVPAALVRGIPGAWLTANAPGARSLVRTGPGDWFALGHVEAVRSALGAPPGSDAAETVGVAAAGPEPLAERVRRAVALALLGEPDAGADVDVRTASGGRRGAEVTLSAVDDYGLGRVVARLQVAAASEGLRAEPAGPSPGGAVGRTRLVLTDPGPGGVFAAPSGAPAEVGGAP